MSAKKGLEYLYETLKYYFDAKGRAKAENKHFEEIYKKGFISEETFNSYKRKDDIIENESNNFSSYLNDVILKYNSYLCDFLNLEPSQTPSISIRFNDKAELKRENYWFEGSVTFYQNRYEISLNSGTILFLNFISKLYGTVASKVPDITLLIAFNKQLVHQFLFNQSIDKRSDMAKAARPDDAYIIHPKYRSWISETNLVQHFLSQDISTILIYFLLGHEFGHVLLDICRKNSMPLPTTFLDMIDIYKYQLNIKDEVTFAWAEESTCDYFGYYFSLLFLKNSRDYFGKGSGFFNLYSILTSRENSYETIMDMQEKFNHELGFEQYPLDNYTRIFSAIKIFFYTLSNVDDNYYETHPSASKRLEVFLNYAKQCDVPQFLMQFGNAFEILHNCLLTGKRTANLDHPLADYYNLKKYYR